MPHTSNNPSEELINALALREAGLDPELTERAVFPGLIPAQPTTARKARCTGVLMGRPGPRFVRRGRSIRYRLSDVLEWLAEGETYGSTAEAGLPKGVPQ